jgi:hypothetical protein
MSSAFENDVAEFLAPFLDTRWGNLGLRSLARVRAITALSLPLSNGWTLPMETARAVAREDGSVKVLVAIDQILARMDYPSAPLVEGRTYRCSGPGSKRGHGGLSGARHPTCITDNARRTSAHFGPRHLPRALKGTEESGPEGAERYALREGTTWTWDASRKRWTGQIRTRQNACMDCRGLPKVKADTVAPERVALSDGGDWETRSASGETLIRRHANGSESVWSGTVIPVTVGNK